MAGPEFAWTSDAGTPPLTRLDSLAGDGEFGFFWNGDERWVAHRKGEWRFYATGFKVPLSLGARLALVLGACGVVMVLLITYRCVRWLFSPIRDLRSGADRIADGALHHRVATDRDDELGDLTRSVNAMADRLQTTLEAKRQLLLAIGHELRTPLTRAKLLLEMQPEGAGRAKLGRNLDEMGELVASLLEAEALSENHAVLNREPVDVVELLSQCADRSDGRISLEVEPDVPMLFADRLRLSLVVRNLLSNAVQHGGGAITLRAARAGDAVVLSVTDQGPGIAPAHLEKLGQPFYRPDPARSRKTGGHGLGLYLSGLIVESHGGKLQIDSCPGEGTVVRAVLPLPTL